MAAQPVPLDRALPAQDWAALAALGERASRAGAELWVVGGAVRDAFLGRPIVDVDLTSDMPAVNLARVLGLEARARSQFSTVKVRVGSRTMDLATTRSEHYAHPGALPSIALGTMASDLGRRDFSINAMAASLAPGELGMLLDPFDGLADLRAGLIRGLDARTFQDDATRMLRAARYAARLGLRLHPLTRRWLRRDLGYMDAISPSRVHREIMRTLAEPRGTKALLLAHRLGVLGALHPALGATDLAVRLRRASRDALAGSALLGVLLSEGDPGALAKRLGLTARERRVVAGVHRLLPEDALSTPGLAASRVGDTVGDAPDAAVDAVMALRSAATRRNLRRYRARAGKRPALNGHDLLAMGVPQGEGVGTIMRAVKAAVMDGKAKTRRGEIRLVRRLIHQDSGHLSQESST